MFGEDDLVRSHKSRSDLIFLIIVGCFSLIVVRLWYLQILKGDEFYRYSLQNRLRREIVSSPRGLIFSRNNQLLVSNTPRFDAILTPQYIKNKKDVIQKLSKILTMDEKRIKKILRKNRGQARYRPIVIKKNISRKEVALIETENNKIPGVSVRTFISREYLDQEVGAHLFGYISEITQSQLPRYRKRDKFNYKLGDFIGQSGVEEKFDLFLRGKDGHQFMEVDARGRMKRYVGENTLFGGIRNEPARPGNNIRLTIDRDMQKAAFKALEGKVGAAVAVDVNTGEILAMVSRPSFDPGQFSKGLTPEYWNKIRDNKFNPMRDKTIQEHYPPGSTFKPFTAITALEEKIVTPSEIIQCPATFKLGRATFNDWKRGGHGDTDVYKSLRESVDVYFYKVALEMDVDVLAGYARMFGLGSRTGISLPRETSGLIPTKDWKLKRFGVKWQKGETINSSIGQGYNLVTPLQLAMSYATIANGGKLYYPYIVKEIFSNSGAIKKKFKPRLVSTAEVSKESLDAVKKGMTEVVNDRRGTAWWSQGFGIRMAGKTGTAQVRRMTTTELFSKCKEMPYESRHHGLFGAFAPYDNPRVAVAVVVEHGCSGSGAAAPIARDIITAYTKKYLPKEYEQRHDVDVARFRRILNKERKAKEALKAAKEKEGDE